MKLSCLIRHHTVPVQHTARKILRNARQNYYFFLNQTKDYIKKHRKSVNFLVYVEYFVYFCNIIVYSVHKDAGNIPHNII